MGHTQPCCPTQHTARYTYVQHTFLMYMPAQYVYMYSVHVYMCAYVHVMHTYSHM